MKGFLYSLDAFPDDSFIVNISVCKDLESLFNFTYKSGHVEIFKQKKEWSAI